MYFTNWNIVAVLVAASSSASAASNVHFLLYDSHDGSDSNNTPLHFLQKRAQAAGIQTTVFGGDLKESRTSRSNDKLLLLRPLLEVFPRDDELIVIGDAKSMILNTPEKADSAKRVVNDFVQSFERLTNQNRRAVVLSVDENCCAPAMSHVHPNNLFADDGSRLKRTCTPGGDDCQPLNNDSTRLWKESMEVLARASGNDSPFMYLNSDILAGYKYDLLHLLDALQLSGSEDTQTVLSALMLDRPDWIVLDYQQQIFGNNHNANRENTMEGCKYEFDVLHGSQLVHTETKRQPLVLQTSGPYYAACLDFMIEQLGGTSQERYLLTSEFFDMVADFDGQEQRANEPGAMPPPSEPDTEEDPMNSFFGAGNQEPSTNNQNYGSPAANNGPVATGIGGIHSSPVEEDNVDSSGFEFPDYKESTNYSYGNYGVDRPADNFWNYGENNPIGHVSNYGGSLMVDGRFQRPKSANEFSRSKNNL